MEQLNLHNDDYETPEDEDLDLQSQHAEAERIYQESKDKELINKHEAVAVTEREELRRKHMEEDREENARMNQRF